MVFPKNLAQILFLFTAVLTTGCATIIDQNEVAVREFLGSFSEKPSGSGIKLYFWPLSSVQKFSIRTQNTEVKLKIPSKEGLNIEATMSILYRVVPVKTPMVLEKVGVEYERDLILPVFRSAAADVTSQFNAKDMHTGKRSEIETRIQERMAGILANRGFEVENVLLKSIQLPTKLAESIEAKLQAEQDAQRMSFVLQQERKEAERKLIEARGVSDAQKAIAKGLSDKVLRFQSIEAFKQLSNSPNTKVIVTDGKSPLMISN